MASPAIGFAAGLFNGVSNTLSPVMAIYRLSLQLTTFDFVKSIALVFFAFTVAQTAAIAFAFAGSGIGLRVQDPINQQTFNRVPLALLTPIGLFLVAKALQ